MDNGLVPYELPQMVARDLVLILVVVDNGLVHEIRMRVEGLTPES